MRDLDIVLAAIQSGYGDATQTELDRRVAQSIIDALLERGWCAPDVFAAAVDSAGGDLLISLRSLSDPPDTITRFDEFDGMRIRTSRHAEA